MSRKTKLLASSLLLALTSVCSAQLSAAPLIWEDNYGAEITSLTGEDDEQVSVNLSFLFPFAGTSYNDLFVGTNGGVQMATTGGNAGNDDDIDYDLWEDMSEFIDDDTPVILPFNTDLDLTTTGTVHFNDFGDRAVFTWNEVGTHEEEEHLSSFQLQLLENGTIIFGYNGIFDGIGEDLVNSLSEGIVVGISASDNPTVSRSDLNAGDFSTSTTVFESWCYDSADSCDYGGPVNTAFDLDQSNIIFTPTADGFNVSTVASSVPEPVSLSMLLLGLAGIGGQRYRAKRKA
ncbi:hypothetical protein [Thalassomonas sp. RHCl1]|uniref:hypothetical protein n=1 Tax=Thalassomonas sp. RHCl1 TaxID=2995320 RepID=UPI00248AF4B0|nr:hypothetical protein [Thalassomonas sp. RHCl1]